MKPKSEFPWRRRQQTTPRSAWWAKLWASRAAWAGVFAAVGATIAFVLTQGVDSLRNARKLPSEVAETYNSFLTWYYDDANWTGSWSSREEGDIDDYQQAEVPISLSVGTERGKVAGEMFNRTVCDLNPMLPPVLVEGEIYRGKMVAYAYAYVGGKKNFLYSFDVTQSEKEPVVTLRPLKDPLGLMPPSARLVRRIGTIPAGTVSPSTPNSEHPDLECPEKPFEYLQRLRKEGKLRNVEELGIAREPKNGSK